MELIEYKKCSTCKKARKYLEDHNIGFISREITEKTPSFSEINSWIQRYKIDINKLFNTSGLVYKNMDLKNKLRELNIEEKMKLLSENAMLIKRPLLLTENNILIGFKENEWKNKLL